MAKTRLLSVKTSESVKKDSAELHKKALVGHPQVTMVSFQRRQLQRRSLTSRKTLMEEPGTTRCAYQRAPCASRIFPKPLNCMQGQPYSSAQGPGVNMGAAAQYWSQAARGLCLDRPRRCRQQTRNSGICLDGPIGVERDLVAIDCGSRVGQVCLEEDLGVAKNLGEAKVNSARFTHPTFSLSFASKSCLPPRASPRTSYPPDFSSWTRRPRCSSRAAPA